MIDRGWHCPLAALGGVSGLYSLERWLESFNEK